MGAKAYLYNRGGKIVGHLDVEAMPPQIIEHEGRYFKRHGSEARVLNQEIDWLGWDYWELDVEEAIDVIYICIGCGRNSSLTWWKCCPEHLKLQSPDVYCQSCVEKLHPGEIEFERC